MTHPPPPQCDPAGSADVLRREVAIVNQRGLHARAAVKFAKCAGQFDAEVTVACNGQAVPGASIMGLLLLAASKGNLLEITARGRQAEAALEAVTALVEDGFGEE